MTWFDWMDKRWLITGWCAVVMTGGFASVLHGIGKRIRGRDADVQSKDKGGSDGMGKR